MQEKDDDKQGRGSGRGGCVVGLFLAFPFGCWGIYGGVEERSSLPLGLPFPLPGPLPCPFLPLPLPLSAGLPLPLPLPLAMSGSGGL